METSAWTFVETLLLERGYVTPALLARVMNISRQAAGKRLKKMAQRGQLLKIGNGRGMQYGPLPRASTPRPITGKFWEGLLLAQPNVQRVALARPGVTWRWRKQVRPLYEHLAWDHRFVFLDFDGVDDASEPFLDELLRIAPEHYAALFLPINVCPELKRKIDRVRMMHQHERPDPAIDGYC